MKVKILPLKSDHDQPRKYNLYRFLGLSKYRKKQTFAEFLIFFHLRRLWKGAKLAKVIFNINGKAILTHQIARCSPEGFITLNIDLLSVRIKVWRFCFFLQSLRKRNSVWTRLIWEQLSLLATKLFKSWKPSRKANKLSKIQHWKL